MTSGMAEVVTKSFEFEGAAAREVVVFLGIEKGGTLELELAEYLGDGSADHCNRITFDAGRGILTLSGRWYDWKTAYPRRAGPRYSFDGPHDLDQKSVAIFKNWARIHRHTQGLGKPVGRYGADIRRAITFHMDSDAQRRSLLSRFFARLFKRIPRLVFESIVERNRKGLWLEVRVGTWIK